MSATTTAWLATLIAGLGWLMVAAIVGYGFVTSRRGATAPPKDRDDE